jgi:hypothetical protein
MLAVGFEEENDEADGKGEEDRPPQQARREQAGNLVDHQEGRQYRGDVAKGLNQGELPYQSDNLDCHTGSNPSTRSSIASSRFRV